jgi:hypothetical protein
MPLQASSSHCEKFSSHWGRPVTPRRRTAPGPTRSSAPSATIAQAGTPSRAGARTHRRTANGLCEQLRPRGPPPPDPRHSACTDPGRPGMSNHAATPRYITAHHCQHWATDPRGLLLRVLHYATARSCRARAVISDVSSASSLAPSLPLSTALTCRSAAVNGGSALVARKMTCSPLAETSST